MTGQVFLNGDGMAGVAWIRGRRIRGWLIRPHAQQQPVSAIISGPDLEIPVISENYWTGWLPPFATHRFVSFDYCFPLALFQQHTEFRAMLAIDGRLPHAEFLVWGGMFNEPQLHVDSVSPKLISGWAWLPKPPHHPVVTIATQGGDIQIPANRYREDLYEAGFGSGLLGYEVPIDRARNGKGGVSLSLESRTLEVEVPDEEIATEPMSSTALGWGTLSTAFQLPRNIITI